MLSAQRNLFDAELSLATTCRQQLVAVVQLYKALGGGWSRKRGGENELASTTHKAG